MVGRAVGGARSGGALRSEACAAGACDAVGDVVDGRYLLMRRAGAGAAGTVWVARDLVREIDVALKLLRAAHLDNATIVRHFASEAELASRMHSPHVVRVLGSGATELHGRYVVYELLEGEDLAASLARRGRLPIIETQNVVVAACRALSRAHAMGILHRDIKPSNLFLPSDDDGGRVLKILDFGLATIAGQARAGDEEEVVGTLEYIAPEVLFGEAEADARSDLYALAVVAYECLTGRTPYAGANIEELVAAYASTTHARPSTLRAGLPAEIDAWFEKALCRDPQRRFGSAKEMADALDAAVAAFDRAPAFAFAEGGIAIDVSSTRDGASWVRTRTPPATSAVMPRRR